ncbi:MAG TPA: hypothetical protein VLH19_02600 [Patescibacteria group bacterium]|nr:hypothetical protein [Patescibacteria group bacterium]
MTRAITSLFLVLCIGLVLATVTTAARMSGMGQELHTLTLETSKIQQKNNANMQQISANSSLHSIHDEALALGYVDIMHTVSIVTTPSVLASAK